MKKGCGRFFQLVLFVSLFCILFSVTFVFACNFGSHSDGGYYCTNCCANGGSCGSVVCQHTDCDVSGSGPWGCNGATSGCYPVSVSFPSHLFGGLMTSPIVTTGQFAYSCNNVADGDKTKCVINGDPSGFYDCEAWGKSNSICVQFHCGRYAYDSETDPADGKGCTDGIDNDNDGRIDGDDLDCCTVGGTGKYYYHQSKFCINAVVTNPGTFLQSTSEGGRVYLNTDGKAYSCNATGTYGTIEIKKVTGNRMTFGSDDYLCLSRGWVKLSGSNYNTDPEACTVDGYDWIDFSCSASDSSSCSHIDTSGNYAYDYVNMNNCCGNDVSDNGKLGIFLTDGFMKYAKCDYANKKWVFENGKSFCTTGGADSFLTVTENDRKGPCCGYASSSTDFQKSYPVADPQIGVPYTANVLTTNPVSVLNYVKNADFSDTYNHWERYKNENPVFANPNLGDYSLPGGILQINPHGGFSTLLQDVYLPVPGKYKLSFDVAVSGSRMIVRAWNFGNTIFEENRQGSHSFSHFENTYSISNNVFGLKFTVYTENPGADNVQIKNIKIEWAGPLDSPVSGTKYYCNQWTNGDAKYHWTNDVDNENVLDPATSSCQLFPTSGQIWKYDANSNIRCCGDDGNLDEGKKVDDANNKYVCYKSYTTYSNSFNIYKTPYFDPSNPDAVPSVQYGVFLHNNSGIRSSTFIYSEYSGRILKTFGPSGTAALFEQIIPDAFNGERSYDVRAAYVGKNPFFKFCDYYGGPTTINSNVVAKYYTSTMSEPLDSIDLADIDVLNYKTNRLDWIFWRLNITDNLVMCPYSKCIFDTIGDYFNLFPNNFKYAGTPDPSNKVYYNFSIQDIDVPIPSDGKFLKFNFMWVKNISTPSYYYEIMKVCNDPLTGAAMNCVDVRDYTIGLNQEWENTVVMIPLSDLGLSSGSRIKKLVFMVPYYFGAASSSDRIVRDIGRFISIAGDTNYYCYAGQSSIGEGWKTNLDGLDTPDVCTQSSPSFSSTTTGGDTYQCCGDDNKIDKTIPMSSYPEYCTVYTGDAAACTGNKYCMCQGNPCSCVAKNMGATIVAPVYEYYDGDQNNNCCFMGRVFWKDSLTDMSYYGMPKKGVYFYNNAPVSGTNLLRKQIVDGTSTICHDGTSDTDSKAPILLGNTIHSTAGTIVDCSSSKVCDYTQSYFCARRNYKWTDNQYSFYDYLNWDGTNKPLGSLGGGFLKSRPNVFALTLNVNLSECCWANQCWNGETCVDAWNESTDGQLAGILSNDDGSFGKKIPYLLSSKNHGNQYVCLGRKGKLAGDTGNDDYRKGYAVWSYVYYKELFVKTNPAQSEDFSAYTKLSYGFCLKNSQCWNGTSCVSAGNVSADKRSFCELNSANSGVWRDRTKFLINRFASNGAAKTNYDISCGRFDKIEKDYNYNLYQPIFNIWWKEQYTSLSRYSYTSSKLMQYFGYQNITAYCTYQNGDIKSIGLVLNDTSQGGFFVLMALNATAPGSVRSTTCTPAIYANGGSCTVTLDPTKFKERISTTYGVYYNSTEGILIVSTKNTDFTATTPSFFVTLFTSAIDTVRTIFGFSALYRQATLPDVAYSNYFYYGHFGTGQIIGYQEWMHNKTMVSVSLHSQYDYSYPTTLTGGAYYQTLDGTYITLQQVSNVFSFSVNISGFDMNTLNALNLTVNRLSNADPESSLVSVIKGNNLYIGLDVTDQKYLTKRNSEYDYNDYFGLFTRNLRTYRFT